MAGDLIQIKRSLTDEAPAALEQAEFAYSYVSNKLFIGSAIGKTAPPIQLLPSTNQNNGSVFDMSDVNITLAGNLNINAGTANNVNGAVPRIQGVPETNDNGAIFCNEFYNTPLYREPNNGKVYKLALEQYKAKNCVYEFNSDTNGVIYWLGSNYGSRAAYNWATPFRSGLEINSSSTVYDFSTDTVIDGEFSNLVNRSNSSPPAVDFATTGNDPNSYIEINLTNPEEFLLLKGIYLKSPPVATYGFLKNWKIESAKVNNEAIEIVHEQSFVNDDRLVGESREAYFEIDNTTNIFCNKLYIRQTDVNSIGTHHLCLDELELYGLFK